MRVQHTIKLRNPTPERREACNKSYDIPHNRSFIAVSLGLSHDGRVVEVLKSPGGTWTIIMTAPNGVSCLLIAGKYWQNVVIKAQELKL